MPAPLTSESLQAFLFEALTPRFPDVELNVVGVPKPNGLTEFVVEVTSPLNVVRVFRPGSIGGWAHARVWVVELGAILDERIREIGGGT